MPENWVPILSVSPAPRCSTHFRLIRAGRRRLSASLPYCRSVIVLVQRIPAGAFRCKTNTPVQYIDMLVLRKMDKVAYRLAEELEEAGHPSFVTAAQETDWSYKRASYGRLSTRHLGVEAGLGTLGLEVNILTPEFGPRVYLTGLLTELELEPDRPITEQVCIGESCSRCLHSCPADAVLHFGIDKRACATEAQEFGFSTILQFFERFIDAPLTAKQQMARSRDVYGFWQGLLRVVGSFGDCPRCLAVCPVGNDYHAHLADFQKAIPEKTPEKVALGKRWRDDRQQGAGYRRPQRLESALGRPRRLPGHGGAAAAGIQKSPTATQGRGAGHDRREQPALAMVSAFRQPLTADDIKAKARALGADLVGIADGANLERYPPDPRHPQRPSDITELDGGRVIVLAKRVSRGVTRIAAWNDRHKYYNDELALSRLEEASLELVYWLEDNGYPAIIVPPTHVDPWTYDGEPKAHMTDAALAPARRGRGGARHARPQSAIAHARIRSACAADRDPLLGRGRL